MGLVSLEACTVWQSDKARKNSITSDWKRHFQHKIYITYSNDVRRKYLYKYIFVNQMIQRTPATGAYEPFDWWKSTSKWCWFRGLHISEKKIVTFDFYGFCNAMLWGGRRVRAHDLLAKELLKVLNCHLHIAFGAGGTCLIKSTQ